MATETVDISAEYLAWDNVETVTVITNIDGQVQPQKTLDYALFVSPNDKRSSYQGMRSDSRTATFWLPIAEFGTKEPDGNMQLRRSSGGEKYRLLDSKKITYGNSESHWDVLMTRERDEK